MNKESWDHISKEFDKLAKQRDALELHILECTFQCESGKDKETLIQLIDKMGQSNYRFLSYMTRPQSEWIGGDSSNPENFKVREPNIVPSPRKYIA